MKAKNSAPEIENSSIRNEKTHQIISSTNMNTTVAVEKNLL
jgi:hypothetical protein